MDIVRECDPTGALASGLHELAQAAELIGMDSRTLEKLRHPKRTYIVSIPTTMDEKISGTITIFSACRNNFPM